MSDVYSHRPKYIVVSDKNITIASIVDFSEQCLLFEDDKSFVFLIKQC